MGFMQSRHPLNHYSLVALATFSKVMLVSISPSLSVLYSHPLTVRSQVIVNRIFRFFFLRRVILIRCLSLGGTSFSFKPTKEKSLNQLANSIINCDGGEKE